MSKGCIMTIGGNLDLYPEQPILKEFFNRAQKMTESTPTIAVIPSASASTSKTGVMYSSVFDSMGANTVIINPENRKGANSDDILNSVDESDAFFLTGGHQLRITSLLGGTKMLDKLESRLEEGALFAGTSAGAVCMTTLMISQDLIDRPFAYGAVDLSQGLGFIEDFVIDTHFTIRGRFPRLIHIVCENPSVKGIGIGESTCAIWDFDEKEFSVIGRGTVAVIDGENIIKNNVPDLELGDTLSVSGITVNILGKNCRYNYETGEVFFPGEDVDE